MLRSTSMSACAFVSSTYDPSRVPLGPSTTSVSLTRAHAVRYICPLAFSCLEVETLYQARQSVYASSGERQPRFRLHQNPDRVRRSRTPCPYDAYPVS